MKNRKIALAFLFCARTDIRDAFTLYRNNEYKEYTSVVYHFQQAIEKTTKAVGLFFNAINYKTAIREISHNDYKVWDKITTTIVEQAKEMGKTDFDDFKPLNFNERVNELKELKSDNERLTAIHKDLDYWTANPEIIKGDDTINIELATTNILLLLSILMGAIGSLNTDTRYPSEDEKLPHERFDSDYILIQNFERLHYILAVAIDNLLELYGKTYVDILKENQ